jgi:hypothetical protein
MTIADPIIRTPKIALMARPNGHMGALNVSAQMELMPPRNILARQVYSAPTNKAAQLKV